MVSVEHLTFHYDNDPPVLRDLSLTIRSGAITTLMGANGCGKSTLLQILTKNLKPDSGTIRFDQAELSAISLKEFARRAAIVHQKNTAPDDLTVERLVAYGRLPYSSIFKAGLDQENQTQVERALALTDLTELRDRRVGALSGGQRQRICIARALALNPEFVVCDEPVSALDVSIQAQIINLFRALQLKLGLTYLFIAHDLAVVKHIADDIGVMYLGCLVEKMNAAVFHENPLHPYTQALLSAVPTTNYDVEKTRERIVLEGEVPSPVHAPSGCPFHPRCIYASEKCSQEKPELRKVAENHEVACHYVFDTLNKGV